MQLSETQRIEVIDTHTGGEPTRVITNSPVRFASKTLRQQRDEFQENFDDIRRAAICEPRGNDVIVGALLTAPENEGSTAGVIFFNNVGYLGMCGHGTMGVAVAMLSRGLIEFGAHKLDTPVGTVSFEIQADNSVTIENVASFRFKHKVALALPNGSTLHGDIAWGGNWFFICGDHGQCIEAANIPRLTDLCVSIRRQLEHFGITGAEGAEIDHIELVGSPVDPQLADSKNFVLCPGGAYDRSPCGTGTSAKLACLAADGKLAENATYRQEGIIGSVFEAEYSLAGDTHRSHGDTHEPTRLIVPKITGSAFVNGESTLILDPRDPFCMGIQP